MMNTIHFPVFRNHRHGKMPGQRHCTGWWIGSTTRPVYYDKPIGERDMKFAILLLSMQLIYDCDKITG